MKKRIQLMKFNVNKLIKIKFLFIYFIIKIKYK